MSFHLRSYQSGDFETLYGLDHQCYPRGIAYSRATLRWFLSLRGSTCLVAHTEQQSEGETERKIIGFIVGEMGGEAGAEMGGEGDRNQGHIITLDVAPAHRRGGVGSALLREVERRMAGAGVRRVELETATDNEVAIAFWQRHGYRAVGVIERYYLNRIDALAMAKPLAAAPEKPKEPEKQEE